MANNPKLAEVSVPFTKENAKEMGAKGGANKKGKKHISTHIQNMLNDPDFELDLEDGKKTKGAPMEAVIKAAIIKAVNGDMNAFDKLAKYGYGTEININVENPIERLLQEFGVRQAIDDDRKVIESVSRTRKKSA